MIILHYFNDLAYVYPWKLLRIVRSGINKNIIIET